MFHRTRGLVLTSPTKDVSEQLLRDLDVGEVTVAFSMLRAAWGSCIGGAPDVVFGELPCLEVGVAHGDFRIL